MSVAQSFGICVPISMAARMIEVPSGTVTAWPSMVSVTVFCAFQCFGVALRHAEAVTVPIAAEAGVGQQTPVTVMCAGSERFGPSL
jgi:hypothetical protein